MTLTPRLQFLHISVWFPLRCHLCKPVLLLESLLPPLQNTFLSILFLSANEPSSRLTEKIMTLLCYELPPLPPPHLQVLLAPVENCCCSLTACPFCPRVIGNPTQALPSSPRDSLRVAPFSDSTIRSAHVSYLGQYINSSL